MAQGQPVAIGVTSVRRKLGARLELKADRFQSLLEAQTLSHRDAQRQKEQAAADAIHASRSSLRVLEHQNRAAQI